MKQIQACQKLILRGTLLLALLAPTFHRSVSGQPDKTVVIEPVGNEMKYATVEVTARAGTQLRLVMKNTATNAAMQHNIAVLRLEVGDDAGIEAVGLAAIQAGPDRDYVPDHEAIAAATPMAEPGEQTEVTFTVPPPGDYPYICLFPGHYVTMRGVLHSVR